MTTTRALPGASRLDWDLVEKLAVTALLGFLAMRLVPSAVRDGAYLNLVIVASEALGVLLVLLRRRTDQISDRGMDWVLGFGGSTAPLLVTSASGSPVVPIAACVALTIAGFLIQLGAKLSLRRSFGIVAANRGVKSSGLYRIVRHPMYAGYVLTHIGFLLSGPNWWNAGLYLLTTTLFVVRIGAEERVLRRDPAYLELAAKVRWRLFPLIY